MEDRLEWFTKSMGGTEVGKMGVSQLCNEISLQREAEKQGSSYREDMDRSKAEFSEDGRQESMLACCWEWFSRWAESDDSEKG